MSTLITLSGGLDSAYVLWDHVKQHPQQEVFVHHVYLRHSVENRLKHERKAVAGIFQWMYDNGFRNIIKSYSIFDYGNLPQIQIKDIQVVGVFQAILLKTRGLEHVDTIKFGWHKGEVNDQEEARGYRIRNLFAALEVNREIKFEFPIINKTRKELVAELPQPLLRIVRSCRKPSKKYRPCMQCRTCLEYIEEGLTPL